MKHEVRENVIAVERRTSLRQKEKHSLIVFATVLATCFSVIDAVFCLYNATSERSRVVRLHKMPLVQ